MTPAAITLEDDFGIAGGTEALALALELRGKFKIIINFTVKYNNVSEFIHHGLVATRGKIDYRKTPMGKSQLSAGSGA
jgi:hypothetical protein